MENPKEKPDESNELNKLWLEFKQTGALELRNRLLQHYLPFVERLAARFKAKLPESVNINDLYSAGLLGLMDTVNKFDPQRGIRFETYSSPRIRDSILDDLRSGKIDISCTTNQKSERHLRN